MSEWKTYKFGDIAELRKEQVAPNGKQQPYIGLEHIEQQTLRLAGIGSSTDVLSNKFKFYSGDILYGKLRPYFRKVYHPKFEGVCSTDIYVIKNKGNIDKSFLYYLVATEDFTRIAYSGSTGTHMPRADWNQLVETEWNVPETIEDQQRIASILSSLDDKIELNRQTNQTLETLGQTLFQEMCVPKGEELPEGWRVGKLGEVMEIKYGKDHKHLEDGLIPVYGSGGIMRFANKALYEEESILIPRKGTLSNLFYINKPFWSVDTMFYSKIKNKTHGKFLFLLLKTMNLASMNVGSAVPSLTTDLLNKLEIVLPHNEIIKKFNELVTPIFTTLESNEQENQTLIALRDSLLPKLMKGEIEV